MSDRYRGGCKCGLVRYEGKRVDKPMFRCHCRDCQQLTGTGHSNMVPLAAETFTISADCKIYQMRGGSGRLTFSGFCPTCGSQLTRRSERNRACIYVHAATLDDPSLYVPEKSIYTESAQAWDTAIIPSKT